jgi:peptidoglycan hydrolase-like protein with peptidoglycan-binding domain
VFGPETADAVRAFQRDEGLEPDGIAGRQTLGRLDAIIAADPRLDAPDPLRTATQDGADRSRPLYRRHRANW